MRHDVWQLDRELMELRATVAAEAASGFVAPAEKKRQRAPDPFDTKLFWLHDELKESDDPVALGIAAWLDALAVERDAWDGRRKLAAVWREEHRVPHLDDPISLAALRKKLLREPHAGLRSAYRRGFVASCRRASDIAVSTLVWRLEREGAAYLRVAGESPDHPRPLAVPLAERLLAATDDFTEEVGRGLLEQARAAVGTDASEGWPARLTTRWMGEVFAGSGLGDGLDVRLGSLPQAWGAASFARALGGLGAAVLSASRAQSVPFSLHRRPRGHREHARRALFAAVIAEPPFASRVLGLGADRVREHRRKVALSLCLSLRFDALRVLLTAALAEGEGLARERVGELTDRHFGAAASPALCGVLPRFWPEDGAALVGGVIAARHRQTLVEEHDEDWFRNPRAIESLRHEDERAAEPAPSPEALDAALAELTQRLSAAIG